MSLLFMDGFDHYTACTPGPKWDGSIATSNAITGPGRFGIGQYLTCASSTSAALYKVLPSTQTQLTGGFAIYVDDASWPTNQTCVWFFDAGLNVIATIALFNTNAFAGPGGLVTGAVSSVLNWHYIEYTLTLATGATGNFSLTQDGTAIGSVTNVVTTTSANPCASIGIGGGGSGGQTWFDDFYVLSGIQTLWGNVCITPLLPAAAGRVTQLSPFPNTNANWQNVKEIPPDNDTTYNYSNVAGQADCYTLSAVPTLPGPATAVKGVQACADIDIDSAGSRTVSVGIGNGTTENYGSAVTPGNTYHMSTTPYTTNPFTTSAWALGDLTTLQAAIKVVS